MNGLPVSTSAVEAFSGSSPERRTRARIIAHWPVRLWRGDGHTIITRTENISCDGFYCVCGAAFSIGEALVAIIEVPTHRIERQNETLVLQCDVMVVRIDKLAPVDKSGLACQILDYSVRHF